MSALYLPSLPILSCPLFWFGRRHKHTLKGTGESLSAWTKIFEAKVERQISANKEPSALHFSMRTAAHTQHYYVKTVAIVIFVFPLNGLVTSYENILFYNPPNNFWELSLDKTDHVIQIGRWISEDIRRPI